MTHDELIEGLNQMGIDSGTQLQLKVQLGGKTFSIAGFSIERKGDGTLNLTFNTKKPRDRKPKVKAEGGRTDGGTEV